MKLVIILALGLVAGWLIRGWYQHSLELVAERAATAAGNKLRDEIQDISGSSARELENKLEGLRDAWPAEIRTEIVKPVFTNVCVSDEFVRLYNDTAARAERTLSGKSPDPVSGGTPPATGTHRH